MPPTKFHLKDQSNVFKVPGTAHLKLTKRFIVTNFYSLDIYMIFKMLFFLFT